MIPAAIAESDGVATLYINSCSGADSLLPLNPEGLKDWTGAEQPHVDREIKVPALRLDTFLDQMGIAEVEYLKINAQGSDLAVVRSAGDRLRDIRKITLTVYPTNQPMYSGAALRDEAIDFMRRSGFDLVSSEEQSFGQQQSLTFVQVDNPPTT
jgi:FkbM family methyltransferase